MQSLLPISLFSVWARRSKWFDRYWRNIMKTLIKLLNNYWQTLIQKIQLLIKKVSWQLIKSILFTLGWIVKLIDYFSGGSDG